MWNGDRTEDRILYSERMKQIRLMYLPSKGPSWNLRTCSRCFRIEGILCFLMQQQLQKGKKNLTWKAVFSTVNFSCSVLQGCYRHLPMLRSTFLVVCTFIVYTFVLDLLSRKRERKPFSAVQPTFRQHSVVEFTGCL